MTSHETLEAEFPFIERLQAKEEWLWRNPHATKTSIGLAESGISEKDIQVASERLNRFAPFFETVFPETAERKGIIESPLTEIPTMKKKFVEKAGIQIPGTLLLKQDNALPVSGSIKARGGFHEVVKVAETIAIQHKLIDPNQNYSQFSTNRFKEVFATYKIAVGSTGNLGLSIGILSAVLGFEVTVHMSSDAQEWKKNLLRTKGVIVKEYPDDYSKAVEMGRAEAENNPSCHFIDDENSIDLFLGYAVAGERLAKQLISQRIQIDEDHPLFVYLPCGVGGGPGGVAYGLKLQFGNAVHCYFAEPVNSPCMLLGMMTEMHDRISVQDIGLNNRTAADGLAVGRPSGFVGNVMKPLLDGIFTVQDNTLFGLLYLLFKTEGIKAEPSALAGMMGPWHTICSDIPDAQSSNAYHLVWSTGGGMVPNNVMNNYIVEGKNIDLFPGKSTNSADV